MFAEIIFQFHSYSFIPTSECERNRKFVTDCVRAYVLKFGDKDDGIHLQTGDVHISTDDVAGLLLVWLGLGSVLGRVSPLDVKCEYVCVQSAYRTAKRRWRSPRS